MERIYDIGLTKAELEILHVVLTPRQQTTHDISYYAIGKGIKLNEAFETTDKLRDKIRGILHVINI